MTSFLPLTDLYSFFFYLFFFFFMIVKIISVEPLYRGTQKKNYRYGIYNRK